MHTSALLCWMSSSTCLAHAYLLTLHTMHRVKDSRLVPKLASYNQWQQQEEGGEVALHDTASQAAGHSNGPAEVAGAGQGPGPGPGPGVGAGGPGTGTGGGGGEGRAGRLSSLHACVAFLSALTHAGQDGRVLVIPAAQSPAAPAHLKYVLLNAAAQFSKVRMLPHQHLFSVTNSAVHRLSAQACPVRMLTPSYRHTQLLCCWYTHREGGRHQGTSLFTLHPPHIGYLQVLASCRAVLLASGTLSPIEALTAQLFPDCRTPPPGAGGDKELLSQLSTTTHNILSGCKGLLRLVGLLPGNRAALQLLTQQHQQQPGTSVQPRPLLHFECGHVIPPDQLLVLVAGSGPSGVTLNLRHEARGSQEVMDEVR
jgi:hypothetical protein